ncbi:TonB-linked outer membrane protein, SusC/RagA family [Pedobacter steynii]|uniref:TonB-linked outer membrane protein, SusC/RagA family n=1 Tax=Pedobacter steynii TaxID=430522 RepID=A0A1G9PAP7_9SPHI|nr:SusC/RagA family TonB-linked outer membrane protein [Pedobacter steynii]NQX39037.1 SusC/RagA family TonB-linked outer membrane protein [Pedobacter steynii]SDL95952.1 TonB-linked outer membrane protein, SusC/RagA family [Pedobacter steynii]
MKLTTFILIITLAQVSAKGFGQGISLHEDNTPLEKVLESIRKQSGYDFIYNSNDIKGLKISVKLNNSSVFEAIQESIKNLPLSFNIYKKNIVITRKTPVLIDGTKNDPSLIDIADPIKIYGKVLDSLGAPMEGATVIILKKAQESKVGGRQMLTTVKNTGEFEILAEVGDRIIISYVGYQPHSFEVKSKMAYQNIVLRKAQTELKEVVVSTGFQTISKERATGSFGKVDLELFSKRTGSTNLLTRLEGQIPGLYIAPQSRVVNQTGIAEDPKAVVRGRGSVLNSSGPSSNPLYVVNGVAVPNFSSVNLDDIEDITVLKDAAASAIWGARSANGVIVIKTKSGSNNSKLSISYNGSLNYTGRPDVYYGNMLSSQQYIQVAKELFDNPVYRTAYPYTAQSFLAPHERILYDGLRGKLTEGQRNQKLDSLSAIDNRSQIKAMYDPAFTTNHTVSASGGNNTYSFYGSMGYSGMKGNAPGSKSDTYSLNLTQNLNAGNRVKISLNTSLVNMTASSQGPILPGNGFYPYQQFRDASGNPLNMNFMSGYVDSVRLDYQSRSRINLDYNPINEAGLTTNKSDNLSLNVTSNVAVKIWKGLRINGTYGYLRSPSSSRGYTDHQAIGQRRQLVGLTVAPTVNDLPVYYLPTSGGTLGESTSDNRSWTVRHQLMYDDNFRNGKDQLLVQFGNDIQENTASQTNTTLLGYNDALGSFAELDWAKLRSGIFPTVTGFGSYSYIPIDRKPRTKSRFLSYFALASYSIERKYSLDLSWRQDFSNQFASDLSSQKKPVWSVGARWQISKEKWLSNVKWLNNLGLRATYGITGNTPYGQVSQYDIVTTLNPATNFFYNQIAGEALYLTGIANKGLDWESTDNYNLAIDYAIFNNRISGSIDAYKRITTGMIGNVTLNPLTGYNSIAGNIGKMLNEGIEMSIRSLNIKGKDFSWSTTIGVGFNHNKLISYQTPSNNSKTVAARLQSEYVIGYPMNALWAYRFAGLDNLGDPQIQLANGTVTKKPNAATVNDLVYMGTTQPPVTGSLSNTFSYKGFNLSANMIVSLGGVMRKSVNTYYSGKLGGTSGSFSGGNISEYFLDRWKKPGDEAFTNIPSYEPSASLNTSRRSVNYYTFADVNVVNASYIKIRDISLSYALDTKLLQFLKIQRASVFASASNFLVWAANAEGTDPELPGLSSGTMPVKHTYSLGINFSF